MAEKTVKSRIQVKRGTSAEWALATTFVPKEGEIIFYSDLNKIKIGDGSTLVGSLPFLHVNKSEIDSWAHNHDDRYYTESEVDTKLAGKANTSHNQASNTINAMTGYSKPSSTSAISTSDTLNSAIGKLEKALDSKGTSSLTLGTTATTAAKGNHTHDDRYYTEGESDARFAPISHNQASNTINAMTGYSKASSASAIAATDSLNTAIGKLEKALDGKGTSSLALGTTSTTAAKGDHTHDGRYYTESEVDTKLAGKSDTGHTHANLTFSTSGNGAANGTTYNGSTARTISYNSVGAAPTSHTHTKSQITDFAHNHDDRYYTEAESDSRFAPISHTHNYLGKTTYEWNKEFAAGSNGAISLGRYNMYDSQLTFDITSTTTQSLSGKLVIATQNGSLCQARVFGDATGTLASKLIIYQSARSNNRSWIEVFCNFDGWSKNKVHIYAVALNSATVEKQMASVTISNGVPATANVTSGDTKWSGVVINDLNTTFAGKGTQTGASGTGTTGAATGNTANSSALTTGTATGNTANSAALTTGKSGTGNTGAASTSTTSKSGTGNTGAASTSTTSDASTTTTSKSGTGNTGAASTSTTGKSGTGNTGASGTGNTSAPSATTTVNNYTMSFSDGVLTITSGTATVASSTHRHTGPSHTHTGPEHTHTMAHTHTGPEHTHTLSHTHTMAHTHTGPEHTHTMAHTHTGPEHTHSVPAHAHGLNSHTHSVPAHAHGLNSHTHTGPSHTHEQK